MFTIILPILNEEKNIEPMYDSLIKELDLIKIKNFEIIFVDDGSTDNTLRIIKNICKYSLQS